MLGQCGMLQSSFCSCWMRVWHSYLALSFVGSAPTLLRLLLDPVSFIYYPSRWLHTPWHFVMLKFHTKPPTQLSNCFTMGYFSWIQTFMNLIRKISCKNERVRHFAEAEVWLRLKSRLPTMPIRSRGGEWPAQCDIQQMSASRWFMTRKLTIVCNINGNS